MGKGDWNAINWTPEMISIIHDQFENSTNKEISEAVGVKLQTLRTKLYELGLYRMQLEYWTDEQISFLKKNYKRIGDKELAEIFQKKWAKEKGWSFKHIEKKRKYLKLKRTKKQLLAIQQRNVDNGRFLLCPVKRWLATGVAQEGEIRYWRNNHGKVSPKIKIDGKWLFWCRWAWENEHGAIPEGMNITLRDGNPENLVSDNLEMLTNAELSRRNALKASAGLSDNYVIFTLTYKKPELRETIKSQPELIQFQRQLLQLKRTIQTKKHAI